jgi:2-amino-4-hydroxy-6-hydroxymethyldihydropteridine diphosphokinase
MILIALGSNLPSHAGGPRATIAAALGRLAELGIRIVGLSRLYETAPVPVSDQPWYVNAVAAIETKRPAPELLALLHQIEHEFGRSRRDLNEARPLDLDIVDYDGMISAPGEAPLLPHPRMSDRAFVLLPLQDVAPDWRHPVSGRSVHDLIAALPAGQDIRPIAEPAH